MGDGEPVRLVAHALQQLQLRRVVGELQRRGPAGDEHLLDPLGQRDHHHAALAEAAQRPQARRQLALAAVDHHDVGQGGEARVVVLVVRRDVALALPAGHPPTEDLLHGGEVVGAAACAPSPLPSPTVNTLKRR